MTELLLAEELFLLLHDPQSGRAKYEASRGYGYAGALVLDLAQGGFVRVEHDRMLSEGGAPQEPLLYRALAAIAADGKARRPAHWIRWLPHALAPLETTLGRSLASRGVVEEQPAKALRLFPVTRWPQRDPADGRALRTRLGSALVGATEPTPREALLISLLGPLDLVSDLVVWDQRKTAKRQAKAIAATTNDGSAVSAAIAQTIQALAAVLAATTVSSG